MKNVPRYECEQSIQGGKPIANFKLSKTGGWVHLSDIKEFLPTATQQANYKIAITLLKRWRGATSGDTASPDSIKSLQNDTDKLFHIMATS